MHFSSIYGKGKEAMAMLPYKARDLLSSGIACLGCRTITIEQNNGSIRYKARPLKIYVINGCIWTPMDLHHSSTFATLAMNHALKHSVIDDLDKFFSTKAYSKRIGKAWKRSYLLYGPPGTGKSGLITAMANHLGFHIYYLELTGVETNLQLTKLLLGITNQSILVIELKQGDDKKNKPPNSDSGTDKEKVTLSGLLDIIDGLWPTFGGEERIVVFRTNYEEHFLDPALLRPGRMDMNIHMGYCTIETFRIFLTKCQSIYTLERYYGHSIQTYLAIKELMAEIEGLMPVVAVTPAEVANTLVRNDYTHEALLELIELLKSKNECASKEEEDDDAKKEDDADNSGDKNDDANEN